MMEIKDIKINRDGKEVLKEKRRILLYGAGEYAWEIKKRIGSFCCENIQNVVDKQYCTGNTVIEKNGGIVTAIEELVPEFDNSKDLLIWAIASPERLRCFIEQEERIKTCYMVWNLWDFWENPDFAEEHKSEFSEVRKLLDDDYSRKVFDAYVSAYKGRISDDIEFSSKGTYFNDITDLQRKGAFVDCGAYDGTGADDYERFTGRHCKVFAFEPDPKNYAGIVKTMGQREDFVCINKGCWSYEGHLSFNSMGDMSSSFTGDGDSVVEVTTIDKIVGNNKVAFIKMDIEGAELEALKGAKKTIERDMPILAISAYHRQDDLITLIPFLSELQNARERYDLYLRHHGVCATELVLYAVPKNR